MDLKREAELHLRRKLIPFWTALKDERQGGFYGYVGFDLKPDPEAPKGCIYTSRLLWFYSTAFRLLGDGPLLACARQAFNFLDRMWDNREGGVFWACTFDGQPLDTAKHTYAQAFAVYGLAAFALASGDERALGRALELYTLIETRMRDETGYLEAFDRSFVPQENVKLSDNPTLLARGIVAERTMNTLLHVMEAYQLLYEASGDGRVLVSLRALLKTLGERVYNPKANRLEVFLDARLRSVFDMQSYGHDIEASWLIDLAAKTALDRRERVATERWTAELARGVLARAFRNGRLLNECLEGKNDPVSIWWVQAETMIGLTNLWQKTGDPSFADAMQATWQRIMTEQVDPREGAEWYWRLDANGAPERMPFAEPWKGPYHNGRMCMELMTRL